MSQCNCLNCVLYICNFPDNGYIEGKELDDFFRHMMKKLGPEVSRLMFNLVIISFGLE